jgi:hypothetical protein
MPLLPVGIPGAVGINSSVYTASLPTRVILESGPVTEIVDDAPRVPPAFTTAKPLAVYVLLPSMPTVGPDDVMPNDDMEVKGAVVTVEIASVVSILLDILPAFVSTVVVVYAIGTASPRA